MNAITSHDDIAAANKCSLLICLIDSFTWMSHSNNFVCPWERLAKNSWMGDHFQLSTIIEPFNLLCCLPHAVTLLCSMFLLHMFLYFVKNAQKRIWQIITHPLFIDKIINQTSFKFQLGTLATVLLPTNSYSLLPFNNSSNLKLMF